MTHLTILTYKMFAASGFKTVFTLGMGGKEIRCEEKQIVPSKISL